MLYREIIAVCSEIHTKHMNTVCGQNVALHIKTQSVPRSKHSVSVIKTSQLMLYREIMAVCSQIHTKHINTAAWAESGIFFIVKPSGISIYNNQRALQRQMTNTFYCTAARWQPDNGRAP